MRQRTREKFEEISHYPWFRSCGRPLTPGVVPVPNWDAAIKEATSLKWENDQLMATNVLSCRVSAKSLERGAQWNLVTDELRPMIDLFIKNLSRENQALAGVLAQIKGTVSWDIMFICLESEFQDLVAPFFFVPMLDIWYAAGHFPCGWTGPKFPDEWDGSPQEGKLMVY